MDPVSNKETPEVIASAQSPSSSSHSDSKPCPKNIYQKVKAKKPKRNKSAFILFSIEMRAKLKSGTQDQLNSNEMMVKLAELWKELPKEERERYDSEAKNDKMRYLQELENFSKSFPSETIHNKTKKNHVKKPCSSYAIFVKEMKKIIKKQQPELKMADVLKIISEKWKTLTDQDRSIYQERANLEKEIVRSKLSEAILKENMNKRVSMKEGNLPKKKIHNQEEQAPIRAYEDQNSLNNKQKSEGSAEHYLKSEALNFLLRQALVEALASATNTSKDTSVLNKNEVQFLSEIQKTINDSRALQNSQTLNIRPSETVSKAKDSPNDNESLLSLLKTKSSEVLADLINFNLPKERFDTLNVFERKPIKLASTILIPTPLVPSGDCNNLSSRNQQTDRLRSDSCNGIGIGLLQTQSRNSFVLNK